MKKLLFIILLFSGAAFAQKKSKNGIIYNEHPYIDVVKKLASLYEKGDAEGMAKRYADTMHFYGMTRYDTATIAKHLVPTVKSLAEAKAGWQHIIDNWKDIKMVAESPARGLQYADGTFTVQSSWVITLVNKKTNKPAVVEMVLFDQFNGDGKIIAQKEYYDPTSLLMAMK